MPYDTGVAVQIKQYRIIKTKLSTADTYIAGLKKQADSLQSQIDLLKELAGTMSLLLTKQDEFQQRNEAAFNDLNESFDKLLTEATKPKKWYEKPAVLIGAGLLGGFLIKR